MKYYEAIFDILAKQLELAKLDEAREGAFIQIVDPATSAGAEVISEARNVHHCRLCGGFTFGIMFALLQGGLARMQHNPATKDKLDLLRCPCGKAAGKDKSKARAKKVGEGEEKRCTRFATCGRKRRVRGFSIRNR